jgi:FkbM family methyltransferase
MSARLIVARSVSRILPPLVSNRLTLRYIYPFDRAIRDRSEFRTRAVTGSYYHGSVHDIHGHMFRMHGYFDWRVIAVAGAVLRPGDLVVEVGANVGTETVALADLVGPGGAVLAIEPIPENVVRLRMLNEQSGLSQVEVIPVALSDADGSVRFQPPTEPGHSGMGHILGREEDNLAAVVEVSCTTLDGLLEGRPPVRLITMDAEGSELNILRGARRCLQRDRPVLIIEACAPHLRRYGGTLSDLQEELERQRYRALQIAKLGLRAPDLALGDSTNWLALPVERADEAVQISRRVLACGTLPCVRGLNPLTRCAP